MENDLVIYSEQDLKELRDFIDYLLYERKYSNLTAKAYYEDVNIFFNFLCPPFFITKVSPYSLVLTLRGSVNSLLDNLVI